MTNQHYINGQDVFTTWGVIITKIEGLNFPKRKTAYSKAWEGYSGTDVIPGGYESREITVSLVLYVEANENARAKIEKFLRDLSSLWEFVLYDVERKEGVVLRLSDETMRNIYKDTNNKHLGELSLKLINDYPCSKTFITSCDAVNGTVKIEFKNLNNPRKIFWGNGVCSIERSELAQYNLPKGTWYIVVTDNTDFNPDKSLWATGSILPALTI